MKLKYKLRSKWEELKLRARMLRAGVTEPFKPEGVLSPIGRLYITHYRNGVATDMGLVSTKLVTDAGVAYLNGAFQGTGNLASNFKYHASGTGGTAESAAQTALVTEVATRATGSQTNNGANIYRTVGTIAYTGTLAIVEHGIFSASSAGTMLDRSIFSAINVISGDSIAFTYDLTLPSGF
jgi:hypothetical protein